MSTTKTKAVVGDDTTFNVAEQLQDHLGIPDSAMYLFRERVTSDLLDKSENDVGEILDFSLEYIAEYKEPPTPEMLEYEFEGVEFREPKSTVEWVVEKLRERYQRNQAKEVLKKASRMVQADPQGAVETALTGLTKVQVQTASRNIEMDSEDFGFAVERYKNRVLSGSFAGVTFGYAEMDEVLGGMRRGNLVYTIGRPKRYKSWQLLKSAVENQFHETNPVPSVFFTLEMTLDEMFDRYACMVAQVPYGKFMRGHLSTDELQQFTDAQEEFKELSENRITFMHPPRGQRTVQHLRQLALEKGAGVVYIDQLKFIESLRKHENRWQEVEYVNEDLKDAAEDFPIMVAAQFNREAASMTEMADLSKIGLSDSIGQTADMLLGLYANKEMLQNNTIEYGVIDARNFQIARWHLRVEVGSRSDFSVERRLDDF